MRSRRGGLTMIARIRPPPRQTQRAMMAGMGMPPWEDEDEDDDDDDDEAGDDGRGPGI